MSATKRLQRARTRTRANALTRGTRTASACRLCGCREVRTDEVLERGMLILNECARCSHRWTDRPLAPAGIAVDSEAAAA